MHTTATRRAVFRSVMWSPPAHAPRVGNPLLRVAFVLMALGQVACGRRASATTTAAPLPLHYKHPGFVDARAISFTSEHHRRAQRLVQTAAAALASPGQGPGGHTVSPLDFGADPSGDRDSSQAFSQAVQALLALAGHSTPSGLRDLGGATLDLQGGVYKVSRPVSVPQGYANFGVRGGTLVAAANFSTENSFLLQIGLLSACNKTSGGGNNNDCNSDVSVQELTLDGAGIVSGCLQIASTMDANVGPAIMVTGFNDVGISLAGSGAGYIHEAWLGQYKPGSPVPRSNATGTAILLDGKQHDCDVNNVIVWSGKVGVNSTNGANRLQGVHTWNLAGSDGGFGIVLHTGVGRVQQCYLDYAPLLLRKGTGRSPRGGWFGKAVPTAVEGNLFLGSSTIILQAATSPAEVAGLLITGNVFHTGNVANKTFVVDETEGRFTSLSDSVIENNEVGQTVAAAGKLGTRATKTLVLHPGASTGVLHFDDSLIFGSSISIDPASTVCNVQGDHATAVATSVVPGSLSVNVLLETPVPATALGAKPASCSVTCTVDQSKRTTPAH